MKKFEMSYTKTIKRRITALWLLLGIAIAYAIIVAELGGGDSREITQLAQNLSRIMYFGGLISIGIMLAHYKSILKSRKLLNEHLKNENDERNRYLHDKSGGLALSIMLALLFFSTLTAALFNMPVFYACLGLFTAALLLKLSLYIFYGGLER